MNLDKIEKKLDSYDSYELAAMYHFIYPTLLEERQKIIDNYLIERGITKDELVINFKNIKKKKLINKCDRVCQRCYSNKVILIKEELWNTMSSRINRKIYFNSINCIVCGFKSNDLNKDISLNEILYAVRTFLGSLFKY